MHTAEIEASSPRKAYLQAERAAWVGLLINLGLGLIKLVGGILGQSFALITDAINSLGDTLTSIVVVFALRYAQKPADSEHPYGHSRAEAVAASNVATIIMMSAGIICFEAFQRLNVRHAAPPLWTVWIALGNILIKECLFRYKRRVGIRVGSQAVIANAWDHRSDAICSFAVLVGLILMRSGGARYYWADEAASLVVAMFILFSGIRLFRSSVSELMDPQADQEFVHQIKQVAQKTPGVLNVEKLWVRKAGLEYFADLHLQVDPQMSVDEGHQIGHRVKDQLIERFALLKDVLIHLEPYHSPM